VTDGGGRFRYRLFATDYGQIRRPSHPGYHPHRLSLNLGWHLNDQVDTAGRTGRDRDIGVGPFLSILFGHLAGASELLFLPHTCRSQ
jgi:hypothetical protein